MAQRQQGYRVTIRAFFPVNPKDLDDTTAKADLVRRVTGGDLSLLAGAEFEKADHLYVSRAAPTPATSSMNEAEVADVLAETELPGDEQPPVDVNGEDIVPGDYPPAVDLSGIDIPPDEQAVFAPADALAARSRRRAA